MATSSRNEPRWWRALAAAAVAGVGGWYAFLTVRPGFSAWFIREDSRFFANGIFSLYDLLSAFGTRMNSMGQYRPIIRVLWGFPAWLGCFDAYAYHWVAAGILAATSALLARFLFLYFGCLYAALWGGLAFAILPAGEKTLYWISSWHNSAAVLFSAAACVLRVESWRRRGSSGRLRALGLFCFYLALASREVCFGVAAVLVAIDWLEDRGREAGELGIDRAVRRSWDVALLALLLFGYVFLIESPFRRAGLQVGAGNLFRPAEKLALLWKYLYSVFWAESDVLSAVPHDLRALFAAGAFVLALVAPLLRRPLGLGTLLTVLGIAPFLALGTGAVEYGMMMVFGLIFVLAGALSILDAALPRWAAPAPVALALWALSQLYAGGAEARRFYAHDFVKVSGELAAFVEQFRDFSASQPPFRTIEITKIDADTRARLAQTMHFLHPGLDELVPDRIFLFTNETLGVLDGLSRNDPTAPFWRTSMKNALPPIRAEFAGNRFRSVHD